MFNGLLSAVSAHFPRRLPTQLYGAKCSTGKQPEPFPRQQPPRDNPSPPHHQCLLCGERKHVLASSLRSTNAAAAASVGRESLKVLVEFWSKQRCERALISPVWPGFDSGASWTTFPPTRAKTARYRSYARIASGRVAPSKGAFCLDQTDLVGIRFHRLRQRSQDRQRQRRGPNPRRKPRGTLGDLVQVGVNVNPSKWTLSAAPLLQEMNPPPAGKTEPNKVCILLFPPSQLL